MRSLEGEVGGHRSTAMAQVVLLILLVLLTTKTQAATYTWKPAAVRNSDGVVEFPRVTIIGSRINWGAGEFDGDVGGTAPTITPAGAFGLGNAIEAAKRYAVDLADACRNPLLSADSRAITGADALQDRWFAAQEMADIVQDKKLMNMYFSAYGGVIQLIVDGKSYRGFKVRYADGASEVWVMNPGGNTSSVRLFDTPVPGSLKMPTDSKAGCMHG